MQTLATYDLMVLAFGAIAFGFYLLIKGGDWAIDAAVHFADNAGLSKLFVGATILAFGTSVPELFASVNANLSGYPGIALGNVIGSNIANILLVLGCTAIIYPVIADKREIMPDTVMMVAASFALVAVMQFEVVSRATGLAMFAVLIAFVIFQYRFMQKPHAGLVPDSPEFESGELQPSPDFKSSLHAVAFLVMGFVALAIGSELLVKASVTIGMALGVPEAVIGMTVVAFGTSLPELVTSLLAAARKHTDMLVGNLVGSNVFNILSIVGITAIISPLNIDPNLDGVNLWVMVGTAVGLAIWLLAGRILTRFIGIGMFTGYLGFMVWQYTQSV